MSTQWPHHQPLKYKGFTICSSCDTILCPANADSKCKKRRGGKKYIDEFRAKKNSKTSALDELKADVEKLQEMGFQLEVKYGKLKAENERLTRSEMRWCEKATDFKIENVKLRESRQELRLAVRTAHEDTCDGYYENVLKADDKRFGGE